MVIDGVERQRRDAWPAGHLETRGWREGRRERRALVVLASEGSGGDEALHPSATDAGGEGQPLRVRVEVSVVWLACCRCDGRWCR